MTSFDRLVDPNNPESHRQKYVGWLPGVVIGLDDPQNLGRVQVVCPTIDRQNPLPNGSDGWIPVMQRFSGAESPGGSFDPIAINDQVVMLPQAGDLRSCIIIGVLPSEVDPPSPHVSRTKKIHGAHTPGQKIELHDDANSRSLVVHPTGLTEKVDQQGNKTITTKDGGRIFLGSGGDLSLENRHSFYRLDKTGNVAVGNTQSNFNIKPDGEVKLSLADSSELNFSGFGTNVAGQRDRVAAAGDRVQQNLAGVTGVGAAWVSQLQGLADDLAEPTTRLPALYELDLLLETAIPSLEGVELGREALAELAAIEAVEIGEKLVGEIDRYRELNLSGLIDNLTSGGTLDLDNLEQSLKTLVDSKLLSQVAPDYQLLQGILQASEPAVYGEILLGAIAGSTLNGFLGNQLHEAGEFINGLQRKLTDLNLQEVTAALDLLAAAGEEQSINVKIATINTAVKNIPLPVGLSGTLAMVGQLKAAISQLQGFMGEVKSRISETQEAITQIKDLRQNQELAQGFGEEILQLVGTATESTVEISSLLPGVIELEALTTALLRLQEIDEIPEIAELPEILGAIAEHLDTGDLSGILNNNYNTIADVQQQIEQYTADVVTAAVIPATRNLADAIAASLVIAHPTIAALGNKLSSNTKGGNLIANEEKIELGADSGGLKGKIVADSQYAGLLGPGSNRGLGSSVLAGSEAAYVRAPGADEGLGALVAVTTEEISLKAPGADLGLGCFYRINQEEAFFYAPGGVSGAGSSWQITQDAINFYAPGGTAGMGSNIHLDRDRVEVAAPGGTSNSGSKITAQIDKLGLYSAGGSNGSGSRIVMEPEKILLKTAGLSGSYANFEEEELILGIPLSGTKLHLKSDRIRLKVGLNTTVTLSPFGIVLSSSGNSITINGGGVQVNGKPLIFGLDLW